MAALIVCEDSMRIAKSRCRSLPGLARARDAVNAENDRTRFAPGFKRRARSVIERNLSFHVSPHSSLASRFERAITRALCESAAMPFGDDVLAGLTARPKTLSPKYFYDELGSRLFEAISALPEYYLTRAELEIFSSRADEIVERAAARRLVELGSGSAVKTRYLIEAALRRTETLAYSAIDISAAALESSSKALQSEYPTLRIRSYQGDYFDGLRRLARAESAANGRTLALFLGSNIGNFDPPEAERFLRAIRALLAPGDALLLGTDLKKDPLLLQAAYDDELGVTASFNLNILARINRELGGHFTLRQFRHRAFYNDQASRVEMHLESLVDQMVKIDSLDVNIAFRAGETIHTESSYKFSMNDVERLARAAGFDLERSWSDSENRFACHLLRCPGSGARE